MLNSILQDATMVYKLAGMGIATGMMNTLLVKMGKKEIADTIDLIIGVGAFAYVIHIIYTSIQSVQQVIALF